VRQPLAALPELIRAGLGTGHVHGAERRLGDWNYLEASCIYIFIQRLDVFLHVINSFAPKNNTNVARRKTVQTAHTPDQFAPLTPPFL
jgi:hypothetical protein